jgi:exodeoxyribonuclease VII small subunit
VTTRERRVDTGADADAGGGVTAPGAAANYEQARDELAEVVTALEAGGLSLDDSLRLWERGEALARMCTTFLEGARARVEAALAAAEAAEGGE